MMVPMSLPASLLQDAHGLPALAALSGPEPAWGLLVMGLLGGLALFLFGMDQLSTSLKVVAGDRMRVLLASLTRRRLAAVGTGAFVTAVIQSSSVTTVLLVGFLSAGLMGLGQSVGVVMGANIGTTVTAQIVAFHVTDYALALVALGFPVLALAKRTRGRHYGKGLFGLGLVFLGMGVMSEAMAPLRGYGPFVDWMAGMDRIWLGILAGALFTALVQSSSATTGVVIVLASGGFINLEAGIGLCLGANVGTCVTALLAAVGRPRVAMRLAVVHVLFNVLGVLVWLPLVPWLAELARLVSPSHEELELFARLARETPRQVANAHTLFNVANTLLFVGAAPLFAKAAERLVPDRGAETEGRVEAKYLDRGLLDTPALALDRVRLELLHLANRARDMYVAIPEVVLAGDLDQLEELERKDEAIDALHAQVVTYLGDLSQGALEEPQTRELLRLMEASNAIENIGDVIETNLVGLGRARLEAGLVISPATREMLAELHATVGRALDAGTVAVIQRNEGEAAEVLGMKKGIKALSEEATSHGAARLVVEAPNRVSAYRIEMDVVADLLRIYYFCRRMARAAKG